MKIVPEKVEKVDGVLPKGGRKVSAKTQPGEKTTAEDTVELSPEALDIRKMAQIAQALPDVRSDRVEKVVNELASGKYRVDENGIAEKIIDEETAKAEQ